MGEAGVSEEYPRVHFSKVPDFLSWSNDDEDSVFQVVLVPKKWWSIKHWRLAISSNKGLKITGLSAKEAKCR